MYACVPAGLAEVSSVPVEELQHGAFKMAEATAAFICICHNRAVSYSMLLNSYSRYGVVEAAYDLRNIDVRALWDRNGVWYRPACVGKCASEALQTSVQ